MDGVFARRRSNELQVAAAVERPVGYEREMVGVACSDGLVGGGGEDVLVEFACVDELEFSACLKPAAPAEDTVSDTFHVWCGADIPLIGRGTADDVELCELHGV